MSVVAVTRWLPEPGIGPLQAAGHEVRYRAIDEPASPAELAELVPGVAAILPLLTERIDAAVLDAAGSSLKVVGNMAVGFDNIDVAACTERGVIVTNTPDVLTDATADLTWALLLAAVRRVGEGERLVRSAAWDGWRPGQLLGMGLQGKVLGIIGMGKIGSAVARRATPFGMRVVYNNRSRSTEEAALRATWLPFSELLEVADVVVLTAPSTAQTRHLLDAAAFDRMKTGAVVVNSARGPLIDEAALVDALRSGRLRAAGLDVYEREPELHPGLRELQQVVLLPHLGSATEEARAAMVQLACDNIVAVLAERPPLTPVNRLP